MSVLGLKIINVDRSLTAGSVAISETSGLRLRVRVSLICANSVRLPQRCWNWKTVDLDGVGPPPGSNRLLRQSAVDYKMIEGMSLIGQKLISNVLAAHCLNSALHEFEIGDNVVLYVLHNNP